MKEITVNASLENVAVVTSFVDEQLELLDASVRAQAQIDVAIDELFSNIAYYAYPGSTGTATIRFEAADDSMIRLSFIDQGVPYNPLEKEDPDTGLPAAERPLGGLGIFLVKKTMDDLSYQYIDGRNITTITKTIR